MIRISFSAFIFLTVFILTPLLGYGQEERSAGIDKPKIIIGVVVDQMRWDYLYRYYDRYTEGGFKRMLKDGFSFENTMIDYAPTVTAAGHAGVFTGSVPAIHGIAGNNWFDRKLGREVYCAEDTTVQRVGASHSGTSRSPRNMYTTTVGDELKLSNNSRSKVIGVSFKDRGAIFPAGHLGDGAYWYDADSGHFVTSSYYMDKLPVWMVEFNDRGLPEKYLQQKWETLYPPGTYRQSTEDDKSYEELIAGKEKAVFPYDYSDKKDDYGLVRNSPFGNTLTFDVAKAAIEGERLGTGDVADLLAISLSSPDGLGHGFGPNAIEIEDMYLRLDRDFAEFFNYLDQRFGKDEYLFFITADHGVSHSPGFLEERNVPTGIFGEELIASLISKVKKKYGLNQAIVSAANYQLYLNNDEIAQKEINRDELMDFIIYELKKIQVISNAIPMDELGSAPWPNTMKSMFVNGYNAKRGGDIAIVMQPGWKAGSKSGASHGSWYPYDAHIPLIWMGWNISSGQTHRRVNMSDIAPTLSAMLKIQMPSGSIGRPLIEITE